MEAAQGIDPDKVCAKLYLVLPGPQAAHSINVHGGYLCATHVC